MQEIMDNVIKFPRNYNGKFSPVNESDVEDKVISLKHHHINETLATVIPNLFMSLDAAGFDFGIDDGQEDVYIRDGAFLVEAVRSLLCKYHGLEHPFNTLAQEVFTTEGVEYGSLKIVEELNLKLKTEKEIS